MPDLDLTDGTIRRLGQLEFEIIRLKAELDQERAQRQPEVSDDVQPTPLTPVESEAG